MRYIYLIYFPVLPLSQVVINYPCDRLLNVAFQLEVSSVKTGTIYIYILFLARFLFRFMGFSCCRDGHGACGILVAWPGRRRRVWHVSLHWKLTFFFKIVYLFYFWLCWVFPAAPGLSLVVRSVGYSSLQCSDFSLWWLLVTEHGL